MGVELVFLYGPPYAGKTLFYLKHFQATHQRVCPSAIFDSESDVTLRCLILKIVTILKKGKSVVLDDENEFRHTRASYINLIRIKVPECKLLCIEFLVNPSHGRLQCNWAREWNIAQVFVDDESKISKFNPLEKERKLCQWFEEEKIDAPCESEGFDVSRVQTGLCCNSPFKFEVPGLLIQMEVLRPDKTDDKPSNIENLATVINNWSSINTTGRVIFLGDIQHSCSQAGEDTGMGEDECCSCLDQEKERLRKLALKVDTPIYFALVDYSFLKYPFILPPQPGLIAWIQRLHTVDIAHKSSLYICTTEAHMKMAQCAGLKTFKAKTVFSNPRMVTAINCRTRQSAVTACVSESTVCYYGNIILPSGLELESKTPSPGTRPSLHIPLLDDARASCKQKELPCIATEIAMGRCHGVCFKNLEMLERYQEVYQKSASPADEVLCTPFKPDCVKSLVPSQTANEQNIVTSAPIIATDEQDAYTGTSLKTELQTSKSDNETVVPSQCENENMQGLPSHCIKIERGDIERLALSENRYKKGKAIQHLVKELTTTPDNTEELLQILCTCTGSQGQHYDVFVVVGNDGIKQAKCSCLDSAGQTGQCKHVVAMLLKYVDKDEQNMKEKCCVSISNPASHPEKNESGKHSKSFKRKRKRAAGWQNTHYVLSSQELLETAKQILQESSLKHNQSHQDKTEDDKQIEIFSQEATTPKDISSIESSRELSKEETAETANDTSSTKQHDSCLEDKVVKVLDRSSSKRHFTENSDQMNEKEQSESNCSLHEESKRKKRSYGKSILDEII